MTHPCVQRHWVWQQCVAKISVPSQSIDWHLRYLSSVNWKCLITTIVIWKQKYLILYFESLKSQAYLKKKISDLFGIFWPNDSNGDNREVKGWHAAKDSNPSWWGKGLKLDIYDLQWCGDWVMIKYVMNRHYTCFSKFQLQVSDRSVCAYLRRCKQHFLSTLFESAFLLVHPPRHAVAIWTTLTSSSVELLCLWTAFSFMCPPHWKMCSLRAVKGSCVLFRCLQSYLQQKRHFLYSWTWKSFE